MPSVLYENLCAPGVYEWCTVEDCNTCSCSTSADCEVGSYCQPAADFSPSEDCRVDLDDCQAVSDRLEFLEIAQSALFTDDVLDALEACEKRLQEALDACNGVGGAAGGGGASGAGGEAGRKN